MSSGATIHETTIDSVVRRAAHADPDAPALISNDRTLSYGELAQHARGFAAWLRRQGLETGETVSLWLPNGLAWAVAQVGVAQAGGTVVPVNTKLQTDEVRYIVEHSRSRVLVAPNDFLDRDYRTEANAIADDLGCLVIGAAWNDPDLPHAPWSATPESRPDAPAVVQYTSGTTGVPKGCMLSHRSWTNNARISAAIAGIDAGTVVFTPSPFFHLFGSLTGLMGALSHGACLATVPVVTPDSVAEQIARTEASYMVAVPTVWLDLMRTLAPQDIPSLRSGFWGGAGFPESMLERAIFDFGWNLQAIYGMTEAPTLTQVRPSDPTEYKLTTVGTPTPGVELRLLDGASMESADGSGEIAARGYNRMLGYFEDPAATADRIEDGWIRTGDIGRLTETGHLIIEGRLTDMIITGGANVYAREVESVLMKAPGVDLAAVVAAPDDRLGEVPVAFVQLAKGSAADQASLQEFCRLHLAAYKVPRAVHLIQSMPLTGSGKIEKVALQHVAAMER